MGATIGIAAFSAVLSGIATEAAALAAQGEQPRCDMPYVQELVTALNMQCINTPEGIILEKDGERFVVTLPRD